MTGTEITQMIIMWIFSISVLSYIVWQTISKKTSAERNISKMRKMALTIKASKLGLSPTSIKLVWGVLMETSYDKTTATLICLSDGAVSFYWSDGSAVIGAGQQAGPRQASDQLISKSNEFLGQASLTKSFPIPSRGECIFYFRTFDGVYKAVAREDDLKNGKSPLSSLFYKAHDVITEIRLCKERIKAFPQFAASGDISNIKRLMEIGVGVNSKNKTGLTALMSAAFMGKDETVKFLLNSNAQIDKKNQHSYTALMFAANKGQTVCASLLIQAGADVNAFDNEGATPIMLAAQHGYNDVVRLLLEKGADPHLKGIHGLSAIGFAKQNGHEETEKILRSWKR